MSTLIIISAFVLVFLVCLLVLWWWTRKSENRSSGWLNPSLTFKGPLPNALTSVLGAADMRTRIVFNGQEYSSVDEMPEEARRIYEQAMSGVLADTDKNGIPDLFERGGASVFHTELTSREPDDPAEKLKQLKDLRDSDLITENEYETKKAEILARM